MDKIKRYIDCYIPTETCNLRCHYCYISQKRKFNSKIVNFKYPLDVMRRALSKDRLGGSCLINLCAGGETLLSDEILPLAKELIEEGHYVMIVTNGTITKRFEELSKWAKPQLERLFFKVSFHYLEMKRLGFIEKFFENVNTIKKIGASFTVEITPSDELVPYINDVKLICKKKLGTLCHITIARDDRTEGIDVLSNMDFDTYKNIWSQFESKLFEYKTKIFYQRRKEFCYAGDWSAYLNLENGDLRQCYSGKMIDNIYSDINSPIKFQAIGEKCPLAHCYNGHSFLSLGVIPELESPTYAQLRNRVCEDGSEWLSPTMKNFMSSKLIESNKEYSKKQKKKISEKQGKLTLRGYLSQYKFYQKLHDIKEKFHG